MKNRKDNQEGLASIIVVTSILIVLALLTIGFTKIMDRELRQTLDRELATQANYSAESGLNDAKAYVSGQLAAGKDPSTDNQCIAVNSHTPPFVHNGSISGDFTNDTNNNTDKYTCVIIDSRPSELVYDINAGNSVMFKMIPYDNAGALLSVSDIFFSWENNNYNPGLKQPLPQDNILTYRLPKEDEFNDTSQCSNGLNCTGMLEVTIYPVSDSNNGNNPNQDANLAQNARTYFLYSNAGGGSVGTKPYSANGQFINGNCNSNPLNHPTLPYSLSTPRYCNSAVNGLPEGVNGARFYYVRIRSLYTSQSISIQAASSTPIAPAKLGGAQALIDVTAAGNDVLKRIAGRAPMSNTLLPSYSIQSTDTLCKQFKIPLGGGGPADYLPAVLDDPASNVDNACLP